MRIKRARQLVRKPKPRPKPVAKAKAPGKFVNPYKPKKPITLPPGTKYKPIPPGVRKGPVGGGKPQIRPAAKPKVKPRGPSTAIKRRVRRKK